MVPQGPGASLLKKFLEDLQMLVFTAPEHEPPKAPRLVLYSCEEVGRERVSTAYALFPSSSECALIISFDLSAVRTFRHCGNCQRNSFQWPEKSRHLRQVCQGGTAEASCSKVASRLEMQPTTRRFAETCRAPTEML